MKKKPIVIARKCDDRNANYISTDEYVTGRVSYVDMIERGEPFCLPDRTPLIYAFGPRTYWKMNGSEFEICGEGFDPEDFDEIDDVLELRRQGNVFGRWHSQYAIEGDMGYQSYLRIESISYSEYLLFMHGLENQNI